MQNQVAPIVIAITAMCVILTSSSARATGTTCPIISTATPPPPFEVNNNGKTYCTVRVDSYPCSNLNRQTTGVTSNGFTICLDGFIQAMSDANQYFTQVSTQYSGFLVKIPAGNWNLSFPTTPSSFPPIIQLPSNGPPPNEQLIIQGSGVGANGTTLTTSYQQRTISGSNISRVKVASIIFGRDYAGLGQGILAGTATVDENIAGGSTFPTPALFFNMQGPHSSPPITAPGFNDLAKGIASGGMPSGSLFSGDFIRAYDNVPVGNTYTPTLDAAIYAGQTSNSFVAFHNICNVTTGNVITTCLYTGETRNSGVTLTTPTLAFLLGLRSGTTPDSGTRNAFNLYTSLVGTGVLGCMREASSNKDFARIDDSANPGTGTDIEFDHLTMTEAANSTFYGVSGLSMTSITIQREPAVPLGDGTSQLPCLSTDGGGFQIYPSSTGATDSYGHSFTSVTATGTGDIPLEFFDDAGTGTTASTVSTSMFQDSFGSVAVRTPSGGSSNVGIAPYAGTGSVTPNPNWPTTCPHGAGYNCIINEWNYCPSRGYALAYCPVELPAD